MIINAIAFAKINWSLNILSSRDDGFHELDMLMQRVTLHDDISFENDPELNLIINNRQVYQNNRNLVLRAAAALNEYAGTSFGAKISMTKRIPVRAGLGGGSADCAVALMALNRLWGINMPHDELLKVGMTLGSDISFCMEGAFARVSGTGNDIYELPYAPRIPLVLVMPETGLSTQAVFTRYDEMNLAPLKINMYDLADALRRKDFEACKALSGNSLEAPAKYLLSDVGDIIDELYKNGARFARMTGSGSCVFGAFNSIDDAAKAIKNMGRGILTSTRSREQKVDS